MEENVVRVVFDREKKRETNSSHSTEKGGKHKGIAAGLTCCEIGFVGPRILSLKF